MATVNAVHFLKENCGFKCTGTIWGMGMVGLKEKRKMLWELELQIKMLANLRLKKYLFFCFTVNFDSLGSYCLII